MGICVSMGFVTIGKLGGVISLRAFTTRAVLFKLFAVHCVSMHGYYGFRIGIETQEGKSTHDGWDG